MNNDINPLFPVFLKLENLRPLLVGGGPVAAEKFRALRSNAPASLITVVAEEFGSEMKILQQEWPETIFLQKSFEESDLRDKDIVLIAVNSSGTSSMIREAARRSRLLVNVADKPELCDFYLGAIVQKGSVKIAISTNGQSPTLAKRLRQVLQELLPDSLHQLAGQLGAIRARLGGDLSFRVEQLNRLTRGLVEKEKEGSS